MTDSQRQRDLRREVGMEMITWKMKLWMRNLGLSASECVGKTLDEMQQNPKLEEYGQILDEAADKLIQIVKKALESDIPKA